MVTSSLGSHGATGSSDLCVGPSDNDHAQLLGAVRNLSGTFQDLGFLAWDTRRPGDPSADSDPASFGDKAAQMVEAAGEGGCELEATLEAWYRFLIDPAPPAEVVLQNDKAVPMGVDQTILAQRAAFLRPDSAVVIGILSDENDCSIVDEGYGWLAARQAPLAGSTSQCARDPNDPCCTACNAAPASGCPDPKSDESCQASASAPQNDSPGLRCFQQKRRFGIDLLYPVERYVNALTTGVVPGRDGELVQNPLFAAQGARFSRGPGFVSLMEIVGVPWQDIADEESLDSPSDVHFMTPVEVDARNRWDTVLGDPSASPPVLPTDPLMIESVDERKGVNPITHDAVAGSDSSGPTANRINGHEHTLGTELQYACTFPLQKPRSCAGNAAASDVACDCADGDASGHDPACQSPTDGAYGTTQYLAKAYPGTRFLQLLKGVVNQVNGSLASVCPKDLTSNAPAYGYRPAMDSVVMSLRNVLIPACFPIELPVNRKDGSLAGCEVVAAAPKVDGACDCERHGSVELSSGRSREKALAQLKLSHGCGVSGAPDCQDFCFCQLSQLTPAARAACQNDPAAPDESGFCYISAQENEPKIGNPELIADCSLDQRRLIRFVGDALSPDSRPFVVCDQPLVSAP